MLLQAKQEAFDSTTSTKASYRLELKQNDFWEL